MNRLLAFALSFALAPAIALAQPVGSPQSLPMVVDLKKAPVGAYADYSMSFGEMQMKSRWALVARDAKSNTLEMSMDGAMTAVMGGKVTVKMVLDADPVNSAKPVQKIIMQMGNQDPMEGPADAPAQKFQKPDPKTLIGKEEIKVAAGTFKTSHYRDHTPVGTVDVWVSEEVPPMGLVKVVTAPEPPSKDSKMPPIPAATMELTGTGKGAKPIITKPAKPFDPTKMMGAAPASKQK